MALSRARWGVLHADLHDGCRHDREPAPPLPSSSSQRFSRGDVNSSWRRARASRHAIVEAPGLKFPVAVEQRELHRSHGDASIPRRLAQAAQIRFPVARVEPAPRGFPPDGAQRVQELPDPDVEHAVAPRVDQREDGRGDGHAHTGERQERIEAASLAASGERRARCRPDPSGRVAPVVRRSARRFPAAHLEELRSRELAPAPHLAECLDERTRRGVLEARRLSRQQRVDAAVRQAFERHGATAENRSAAPRRSRSVSE